MIREGAVLKCLAFLPVLLLVGAAPLTAQQQATTRTEEIERARRDKMAVLWPERESPLVSQVNTLVERGLKDGFESGTGSNGLQFVLGGTRSGHGTAIGGGYRRSDLWRDRIGYRATARATLKKAVKLDLELDFPKLRTEHGGFLNLYAKYEHSPRMNYYGPGRTSSEDDLTSYRLEDYSIDAQAGFEAFQNFQVGLTGGFLFVETGRGRRPGVPSIEEVFTPGTTPGLGVDTYFRRGGLVLRYDYRDRQAGTQKGGSYVARVRYYSDRERRQFSFREEEYLFDQYIPYFNRTRVIALRLRAHLTSADDGQLVPYYLQPTLGGNGDLRGFARYRFYGDNYILASAEHRWYAFEGLDMALFADAGKTVTNRRDVDFGNLDVSVGIGFRWKLQGTVFMRIDFARSREGFRWMWTFSDIYRFRWMNR